MHELFDENQLLSDDILCPLIPRLFLRILKYFREMKDSRNLSKIRVAAIEINEKMNLLVKSKKKD